MKLTHTLSMILLLWSISVFGGENPVKVACIGDSVTYGTGIEDRENESYPVQLQKLLGEKYLVGNFGKPGATLLRNGHRPYMEQNEFADAMEFAGDIAIIHLGLNDTDPRNWPNYKDEFVGDYLALIDSVRAANPSVRIIISLMTPITPYHKRFASGTHEWHGQIQEAIKCVANAAGVELIDFHEVLYARPDLLPDSLHPNGTGAGLMAGTVYSAITGDYGGLKLPSIYSDNMILQREKPIIIRGTADAGTMVSVSLKGSGKRLKSRAIASNIGKWEICFEPQEAARDLTLRIEGKEKAYQFENLAIGDIWLCSGQSNMAFMVKELDEKPSIDEDKDFRLLDIKGKWLTYDVQWSDDAIAATQNLEYFKEAKWSSCTQESAIDFSAVGYFFGKMLRENIDVPVGLICNAVGGSTTESWIDRNSLEKNLPAIFINWTENDFIQQWARERGAKNIGFPHSGAKRHPYEPCYLFESGIMPLEGFPIKGVIWYQGESNAHNIELHEKLFTMLVDSWRDFWNDPQMPFHFVQLSSLNRPSWTWFRDSQRQLAERIENCEMAVSSDVGDSLDVHPRNKRPVGERLAKQALHHDYGFDIVPCGPMFRQAYIKNGKVIVEFEHSDGLATSDGEMVRCFEIGDKNGLFKQTEAIIEGNHIVIPVQGNDPRYVRYAWQPFTRANLINGAGLPASTFRTEIK